MVVHKLNKQGNSPIVATILIMALIIGVGGMIGGWINQTFFGLENLCEEVQVGADRFCIENNEFSYDLSNLGNTEIQGYRIVLAGNQITEQVIQTNISANETAQNMLEVDNDVIGVEIIPRLTRGQDEEFCTSSRIEFEAGAC